MKYVVGFFIAYLLLMVIVLVLICRDVDPNHQEPL